MWLDSKTNSCNFITKIYFESTLDIDGENVHWILLTQHKSNEEYKLDHYKCSVTTLRRIT